MICNNKGPDQPAHPRSIISNFVVCFLRRIIPRLASCEKKINFLSSLFSRRDWFEAHFVRNPEDKFSRVVACVACSTALGQIFQVQQIIILKTNIMRRLFIGYVNGITVFDYALHRLIHKSFVTTANKAGERRGFDFLATGLWYDHVLTAHLPGLCVATNDWCT